MIELQLEEVNCPNCASFASDELVWANSHQRQIRHPFRIVRCRQCDLAFLNPRPDAGSMQKCYAALTGFDSPADKNKVSEDKKMGALKRVWHRLNYSNPVLKIIDGGPVLDVGCNRGELIKVLNDRGFEARGVESSQAAVLECRQAGLDVEHKDIEKDPVQNRSYKYIILSHVLEHMQDPVAVLQKLKSALAPDGRVLILVPSVQSPMVTIFGKHWHGWDPPFHLVHFEPSTLTKICNKAGIRVLHIKQYGHPEDFRRSWLLKTKQNKRYLLLRMVLWPIFAFLGHIGKGSVLLASAKVAN